MYIRKGVNCETVPQPGHSTATDAYGNTFENWCVDYRGCDITPGNIVKTGCAPQDPAGKIPLWQPTTYDDVGVARTPSPYNDPPLIPVQFTDDVIEDIIEEFVGPAAILVLGLDQDRDLVIVTDGVQQAVRLEPSTTLIADTAYNHN